MPEETNVVPIWDHEEGADIDDPGPAEDVDADDEHLTLPFVGEEDYTSMAKYLVDNGHFDDSDPHYIFNTEGGDV